MDIIYNPILLTHDTWDHPENKKRLMAFGNIQETAIENGEPYLTLVHTPSYVDAVKKACEKSESLDVDTRTSPVSFNAAAHAVGATLLASQTDNFALVRPPGHHAHASYAKGFCLFNNVAIATQYLLNQGKRVLIFDFDGHLGDGTEEHFYTTNRVLYWSLHQFPAFPLKGDASDIGNDRGTGYTINVPLPPKTGDDVYIHAVECLLPIAQQFKPDVVAVSAGFDAHRLDPLLDLDLSANAYHRIGAILHENFSHIFAVLEGGYNIDTLPMCVYSFLDGINGKSMKYNDEPTQTSLLTKESVEVQLDTLIQTLSPYWHIS